MFHFIKEILSGINQNKKKGFNSERNVEKKDLNLGSNKIKVKTPEELNIYIQKQIDQEGIYCDLNFLDVSEIEDMSFLFAGSLFSGDISEWNVSKVKNMSYMFKNSKFNGDISKWDVSNVVEMESMFDNCSFDQDISSWNIRSAVNLSRMFFKSKFNSKIFKLSNAVRDMSYMFAYTNFTQNLGNWDVSLVNDMTGMFMCSKFNGDISKWNVEQVKFFDNMFSDSNFKVDVSSWKPLNAKSMSFMFTNKTNKDMLKNWDLKFVDKTGMFQSKSLYEDHEKVAESIYNALSSFDKEYPDDFLRFGVPVAINGKYYIIKVCNSPIDQDNWYLNYQEVTKDTYEFQKVINNLFGKR